MLDPWIYTSGGNGIILQNLFFFSASECHRTDLLPFDLVGWLLLQNSALMYILLSTS